MFLTFLEDDISELGKWIQANEKWEPIAEKAGPLISFDHGALPFSSMWTAYYWDECETFWIRFLKGAEINDFFNEGLWHLFLLSCLMTLTWFVVLSSSLWLWPVFGAQLLMWCRGLDAAWGSSSTLWTQAGATIFNPCDCFGCCFPLGIGFPLEHL